MTPESDPAPIEFGRFTLLPLRRQLLAQGQPIELGGRAFDVLMALIETTGNVLSKDDLMSRVWLGKIVEENSLEAQISLLRKALGADRELVRTIAGRGYQSTGPIGTGPIRTGPAVAATPAITTSPTNLSQSVSALFGRDAELREIAELLTAHRLVTLVGPGGIGKTQLGLETARHLQPMFADGVWVAELAPLADPELVPVCVAGAMGLSLPSNASSPQSIAMAVSRQRLLLVLDNCEHVIDAAARMADALLRASAGASVIATSREPLRVEGEYVYRVPALEVPAADVEHTQDLLRTGAVKLFIARAAAADPRSALDDRGAAMIGAICRRLDGIPLAIELAAARAGALGIETLAARLDDLFKLLTGGHRTALPRQQTLRATLDWSHGLLSDSERVALRRLAVFAGSFGLESASAVVADSELTSEDAADLLADLVAKSLVVADVHHATAQYRLLDTTRAYALEKLTQANEREQFTRRHAEHYRQLFERAAAESETQPTAQWLAAYRRHLDNLRAALDWAFSAAGDGEIGAALTIAAGPLWMRASLMDECRRRVEQALAAVGAGRDPRRDMELYAALAAALLYTKGPVLEIHSAWKRTLEIAERLNDGDYRVRALWGLWVDGLTSGEFRSSLDFAQQFSLHVQVEADRGVGDRMTAIALLYLGELSAARERIELMLSRYVAPAHSSHVIRFQFDQLVMARMTLAQILWLQGLPDQAMRAADINVEFAQSIGHALSLCNALGQAACPIALLNGDLAAAERYLRLLREMTERHGLTNWFGFNNAFEAMLVIRGGNLAKGAQALHVALEQFPRMSWALRYTAFSGDAELAQALAAGGDIAAATAVIDEALLRADRHEQRWYISELLRTKGELLLAQDATGALSAAADHYQQGLEWARKQGALAWELRCATSLARLRHAQGATGAARELLAPVYGRFTEGFATADLLAARALLDELQ